VPEELIKHLGRCHAKWEAHTGVHAYEGRVWSGTYSFAEGHGKKRGYIFVEFGDSKCKGTENKRWVPDIQVRVFNSDSSYASPLKRIKKSIDRYNPVAADSKKNEPRDHDRSYFGGNDINYRHASQGKMENYYQYFFHKGLKDINANVPYMFVGGPAEAKSQITRVTKKLRHNFFNGV